ncbi:hypothetical protein PsorP6_017093 [Peronosclerospora sorghi]|uniref:Uncharacterized protein n=1 Tax=Peronosclerospora sorghi TaxID=230839 RepID=A0ACC0WBX4_9STRA|nr:hypothetical protein PsorP6_017093 [Peronosclerospora sorghi]
MDEDTNAKSARQMAEKADTTLRSGHSTKSFTGKYCQAEVCQNEVNETYVPAFATGVTPSSPYETVSPYVGSPKLPHSKQQTPSVTFLYGVLDGLPIHVLQHSDAERMATASYVACVTSSTRADKRMLKAMSVIEICRDSSSF